MSLPPLAAAGLAILIVRAQKQSGNNRRFRSVGIILVAVSAALTVADMILLAADTRNYPLVVWFFADTVASVAPLIFTAGLTARLLSAKSWKKIRNTGIILVVVGIVFCVLNVPIYRLWGKIWGKILRCNEKLRFMASFLSDRILSRAVLVESGEMLLVAYGLHSKDEKQKNFWRCTCGTVNKTDDLFCPDCGTPKPSN